jgi:predicted O-methyltransferase YrrM
MSLDDPRIRAVLERLHRAAGWGEVANIVPTLPAVALAFARGGTAAVEPALFTKSYIAVTAEQGRFMYVTALAIGAKRIVEFGTSYGISTLYLAAAARETGGIVIGSENERHKWEGAKANLAQAGLAEYTDIRLGDALKTLADLPAPVDFVLLDGWKELNLPVLELLIPKLRKGSVVLADDIYRFRKAMAPYVELLQSGRNGFRSTSLRIGGGFEYSVFQGRQGAQSFT